MEAIQYGERSDVKDRLNQTFDGIFDIEHIRKIINEKKLTSDVMPEEKVQEKRLEMERAAAQRLQPHHIEGFFLQAFKALGGQITHVKRGVMRLSWCRNACVSGIARLDAVRRSPRDMSVYVLIKDISISSRWPSLSFQGTHCSMR